MEIRLILHHLKLASLAYTSKLVGFCNTFAFVSKYAFSTKGERRGMGGGEKEKFQNRSRTL